jgi:hypothetical protein
MSVAATPTLASGSTSAGFGTTAIGTAAAPTCRVDFPEPVCAWTGIGFIGTLIATRPIPSGRCLKIGDVTRTFLSAQNKSRQYARFWEFATRRNDGSVQCHGRNRIVLPLGSVRNLGFGARGLGGF